METFSICGGVCCFGVLMAGWVAFAKLSKFSSKATWIGAIVIFAPFCLGGLSLGKFMFLDEQLLHASFDGDIEQMKTLLDLGADPNILSDSSTPICGALLNGHVEAAKLLADRGADLNQPCTDFGSVHGTPLDIAASLKDWKLVEYLKKKGAKKSPP